MQPRSVQDAGVLADLETDRAIDDGDGCIARGEPMLLPFLARPFFLVRLGRSGRSDPRVDRGWPAFLASRILLFGILGVRLAEQILRLLLSVVVTLIIAP